MATTPSNPTPTPTPAPVHRPADNSKQRVIAIAAVVIIALLAANGWLLYKFTEAKNMQTAAKTELTDTQQAKTELEQTYLEAMAELDEMRNGNDQLNTLIDQQKAELKDAHDRIDQLISNQGTISQARSEIAKLNQQVDGFVAEINQLREENALLADANSQLTEERDGLNQNLEIQVQQNQNLTEERAVLVSERDQLSTSNNDLSQKVTRASVIRISDLEAAGQKIRSSGKAVTRSNADNVSQISVCFNTQTNEIAPAGKEEFVIRIVNPSGETLALNNMGSGVFDNTDSGQQTRFTMKDDISYDQAPNALCLVWAPEQNFDPGNYTVEVYNKGYLTGSTTLRLK